MYSVLVYLRYKLKVSNVRFDKILYRQLDIQVKKPNNSRLLQGCSSIKHKTKNNNINPVLFTPKLSFSKNLQRKKRNFKTLKTPRVGQIQQNFIILIIKTIPFHS